MVATKVEKLCCHCAGSYKITRGIRWQICHSNSEQQRFAPGGSREAVSGTLLAFLHSVEMRLRSLSWRCWHGDILVSIKFVSAILGPEMAAPILWAPGKMRSFCRKTYVHKIPRFRRGGSFGFGGGECRFNFYGRGNFSDVGMEKDCCTAFQQYLSKNIKIAKKRCSTRLCQAWQPKDGTKTSDLCSAMCIAENHLRDEMCVSL